MTAQLTRKPEPLATVRPGIPDAFSTLVERCLAKSPSDRPADAQAVLAELDRISGALAAESHREERSTSGETAVPARRVSSVPLVLAGLAIVAVAAAGIWWGGGTRGAAAPTAPDTVVVQGGSDTEVGQPLAADRPLTREDSLAIAAALRDELEQIDPAAARRAPTPAATDEATFELNLERQLSMADSLVRVRLAEVTASAVAAEALAERARGMGGAVIRAPSGPTERRSVMVIAAGSRDRDAMLPELSEAVASEVRNWLARSNGWRLVPADPGMLSERGAMPAEVLVTVAATPAGSDSASLRITVRNATPGSSFGFQVISSRPFALSAGPAGYAGTLGETIAILQNLRRVERGESWGLDLGRNRVVSPVELQRLDSLRRSRGGPPRPEGP
jgi:hypothetical protein